MSNQKRHPVLQFLLTFLIVYMITNLTLKILFPQRFGVEREPLNTIELIPEKKKVVIGRDFSVDIRNTSQSGITLSDRCPEPPLIIERKISEKLYQINLSDPVIPCTALTELPPGSSTQVNLSPWKYAAFTEEGSYRISLPVEANISTEIQVKKPGIFTSVFRAFISKPLLNTLILIASLLPTHSLGWSIILLTLIVRLLLYFPSKQALEGQKKMQAVQPKLEEIKRKHKGNQQRITEETMALWKKEGINPMQSLGPTFIQLPLLIGLFFIIRDSSSIELAQHLLYAPFLHLNWTFSTDFLGVLDLTMIPFEGVESWLPPRPLGGLLKGFALPIVIAIVQFVQMKMTFAKKASGKKKPRTLEEKLSMQNLMLYFFPAMLIFISGSLPAAVSLYWGASTAFGIGQQIAINREQR